MLQEAKPVEVRVRCFERDEAVRGTPARSLRAGPG